jgi:hypothetical protein
MSTKYRVDIVNERFAEALTSHDSRDFWREAKRMRRSNASCWNHIDDSSSPEAIAHLFASKYEELYSCVSYNEDEMNVLKANIDDNDFLLLDNLSCKESIITAAEVHDAIDKLKRGTGDGYLGLSFRSLY